MASITAFTGSDAFDEPTDEASGANAPTRPDDFHSVALVTNPAGIVAETIRALRTRIMAQHVQVGRRALAMCGATMGSGCSFVSANLAFALAQIGVRTALVDADLRKPELSALLGFEPSGPGLSDYLRDETVSFEELAGTQVFPGLTFVHAGALVASPQELLASRRFADLTGRMLREHQVTIFDTTPANGCTDALRVATVAGYGLVVARKNSSYIGDISTLAGLLRADGSKVVGSVLVDF